MKKLPVVDTEARRQASGLLKGLMEGRISNFDFDSHYPEVSADWAVHSIYVRAWHYYDDFREHRLTGVHEPSTEDLDVLKRCALFCQTALPYEWPSLVGRVRRWLATLRGRSGLGPPPPAKDAGDPTVWPFYRRTDWQQAIDSSADRGTSEG